MSNGCIITGTDTDVGKTVVSAMLMLGLGAHYWKPVQSGIGDGIDTRVIQNLTGLPDERFFPEEFIFSEPLSPHRAAEIDNAEIDVDGINLPDFDGPLLIEGSGGLMVPITRENLQINMFKRWNLPVILVARTQLGTINHTLLSLEALWAREIPVHGLIFVGPENEDNIRTIAEYSGEKVLGHVPWLEKLSAENLLRVFDQNFDLADFQSYEQAA